MTIPNRIWVDVDCPEDGLQTDNKYLGPDWSEYIHLDSIYICPECGDSGRKRRDIDHKTCESCPVETICSGICEFKVDCECLKNPNSIASIKRGGSDNAK